MGPPGPLHLAVAVHRPVSGSIFFNRWLQLMNQCKDMHRLLSLSPTWFEVHQWLIRLLHQPRRTMHRFPFLTGEALIRWGQTFDQQLLYCSAYNFCDTKLMPLDSYLNKLSYVYNFASHKWNINRVTLGQSLVLTKRNTPYNFKMEVIFLLVFPPQKILLIHVTWLSNNHH